MLWAVAGLAALIYWVLSLRPGHQWVRTAVKGLAVLPLVPMALTHGAPLVALALFLCSLGDIVLSRPGERAFLGGLVAFALGHLGWIAVFVTLGVSAAPFAIFWPLLVTLAVLISVMIRLLLPRAGQLWGPVTAYIAVIAAMSVMAIATDNHRIIAGAVLFALSDTLLGMQTFVLTGGSPAERIANALIWPLYWTAIALMTVGALTV